MSQQIYKLTRNLRRFRLITFDVTDTLLNFKEAPAVQYAKTAMQHGVTNIDQDYMQKCFRKEFKTMAKMYPNFGRNSKDLNWQQWWIELIERIFNCNKLNMRNGESKKIAHELLNIYQTKECYQYTRGSQEFLKRIHETGITLGVISNFDPRLKNVLRAMSIDHYFDHIFTSYDTGFEKPNKEIFQLVQEHYMVSPHQALHIGNIYEIDYIGARNAGWSSVLLVKDDESFECSEADQRHKFKDLEELLNILETRDVEW